MPESVAVNVRNRNHVITAHVRIGDTQPEGVLLAQLPDFRHRTPARVRVPRAVAG